MDDSGDNDDKMMVAIFHFQINSSSCLDTLTLLAVVGKSAIILSCDRTLIIIECTCHASKFDVLLPFLSGTHNSMSLCIIFLVFFLARSVFFLFGKFNH